MGRVGGFRAEVHDMFKFRSMDVLRELRAITARGSYGAIQIGLDSPAKLLAYADEKD